MNYFLDPTFDPHTGILNEEESRHAIKALRIHVGDVILVGNGKGLICEASVKTIGKNQLILQVESQKPTPAPIHRHAIAVAPTKNTARFEWILEKATEMGIDDIIALETKRTERTRINHNRSERIILAAAKQSQRSYLPTFQETVPFGKIATRTDGLRLLAHCDPNYSRTALHDLQPGKPQNVLIMIGPEGDFNPKEIEEAFAAGFTGVSLGSNRLRTETAAVYAAAILSTWR